MHSAESRFEAAIQSEGKASCHVEEGREREQRSQMHSVESLFRSRHSVGRERDTVSGRETASRRKKNEGETREREQRSRMNSVDSLFTRSKTREREQRSRMHSAGSLFRSRHSVDSERDTVTGQETASEREKRSRMHSIETLLRSHHSVGRVTRKSSSALSRSWLGQCFSTSLLVCLSATAPIPSIVRPRRCAPGRTARCRLKSYLAGFVLDEIGCEGRVNERRY
jgi:hypothetical protein